jgi:hypothetical protein
MIRFRTVMQIHPGLAGDRLIEKLSAPAEWAAHFLSPDVALGSATRIRIEARFSQPDIIALVSHAEMG